MGPDSVRWQSYKEEVVAVSYTHLDVYKRQVLYSGNPPDRTARFKLNISSHITSTRRTEARLCLAQHQKQPAFDTRTTKSTKWLIENTQLSWLSSGRWEFLLTEPYHMKRSREITYALGKSAIHTVTINLRLDICKKETYGNWVLRSNCQLSLTAVRLEVGLHFN